MIELDGSMGEGGGQILRSALALSLVTGAAFAMKNVRAGRARPGLLRQHLACVRAAVEISGASVDGDDLGSTSLVFRPSSARAGDYHFAVGSAGSATLVLQTVLVPLLLARGVSSLRLEGGTHNPSAPPYDFVERVFLETLRRAGARVSTRLERAGFYPAGGGAIVVEIEGGAPLAPLELLTRGTTTLSARVLFANIAGSIAVREANVVMSRLGLQRRDVAHEEVDSAGPGNAVIVECNASDGAREITTAFGARSVSAEKVANEACDAIDRYLASGAPVGEHLADQLLLPLALGSGGVFRTSAPSTHAQTNARVLEAFLGRAVHVTMESENAATIRVVGRRT